MVDYPRSSHALSYDKLIQLAISKVARDIPERALHQATNHTLRAIQETQPPKCFDQSGGEYV